MLIVLEGIDGAGKSTQREKLREWFESAGEKPVVACEPTHLGYGAKLRNAASTGGCKNVATEIAWFLQDRRDHAAQVINPALRAGSAVLLDRYIPSSMAYQSRTGEFTAEQILELNLAIAPKWDLLIVIDLPVEKAMERLKERGLPAEAYEKPEFLTHCRRTYLTIEGAVIIDGDADPEMVHLRIVDAVLNSRTQYQA
jgi:dTMP kinase